MTTEWQQKPWLVIDTETTGVDIDTCRIIEIGWVWFEGGKPVSHRSQLIDPQVPIPPSASEVNGITDEMVAGAPLLAELADELLEQVRKAEVIVGYNASVFDVPLLRAHLGPDLWDEARGDALIYDPLVLVRHELRYWRGKGRHRLGTVAQRLDLSGPEEGFDGQAHRAAWDCVLAGRVGWHFAGIMTPHAGDAQEWLDATAAEQQRDFEAWKASQQQKPSGITEKQQMTLDPEPDPTAPFHARQALLDRLEAAGGDPGWLSARPTPELQEMVAELDDDEPAQPDPVETAAEVPPEAEAKLGVLAEAIASTPPWHENVKAARKGLGWTQADLGALVGVSGSYISRLERGKTEPSPEEEAAINEALAGQRGAPPSDEPAATSPEPAAASPVGRVELLVWNEGAAMWCSDRYFDSTDAAKAWLELHGSEGGRYSFRVDEAVSIRLVTQRVLEVA